MDILLPGVVVLDSGHHTHQHLSRLDRNANVFRSTAADKIRQWLRQHSKDIDIKGIYINVCSQPLPEDCPRQDAIDLAAELIKEYPVIPVYADSGGGYACLRQVQEISGVRIGLHLFIEEVVKPLAFG